MDDSDVSGWTTPEAAGATAAELRNLLSSALREAVRKLVVEAERIRNRTGLAVTTDLARVSPALAAKGAIAAAIEDYEQAAGRRWEADRFGAVRIKAHAWRTAEQFLRCRSTTVWPEQYYTWETEDGRRAEGRVIAIHCGVAMVGDIAHRHGGPYVETVHVTKLSPA